MAELSIRLLGSFRIHCDAACVHGLEAGKARELLGYLLLHRDRPHPRELLAGLLWGDCPTAQARKHLRQSLWQLQSVLSAQPEVTIERFLIVNPDWVRLDASTAIWLDVAVIEDAFRIARRVAGEALSAAQAAALRDAALLYDGDLLEGWYQDWCIYARETVQHAYLVILDKLMAYSEAHRLFEDGIEFGERILRCDVAREQAHRRLMRLHCLAGDRTAALRQFERCVAALDRELGVGAAHSTLALLDQIRADQLAAPALPDSNGTSPPADPAGTLLSVVANLKQLQDVLGDLHLQLQRDIRIIELIDNAS
jgi:DNA-binding SARP family transcriptional activator